MRSDTWLQFIVDAIPALIAYVDNDERYRFNNHAYEQWFGRPRSEVYGRTVREIVGEDSYAATLPHVRAALAGQLVTFEDSLMYPDGITRHISATYAPDARDDGSVRGFAVLVTDITDHKRAEEERAHLRRRAEELARTARTLRESADTTAVAEAIGQSVLPLFGAQASVLWLLQPDGSLACVGLAGRWLDHFQPGDVLPPGFGLVGRAVQERRGVWTSDLVTDPAVVLTEEFRRSVVSAGHHAVTAVPLQVKGTIIGALSTAHGETRRFSQGEMDLLQAFADQAALAIWNVQLLAQRAGCARRRGGGQPSQGSVPRAARTRAAQSTGTDPHGRGGHAPNWRAADDQARHRHRRATGRASRTTLGRSPRCLTDHTRHDRAPA